MKLKAIAITLFTLAATGTAHAQSGGMKGMDMKDMKTENSAALHKATGMVTKVDKDKVTIQHGPVQSMSWPAMTMAFKVRDKALMGKLGKDRKVDFEFRQEGKDFVITAVK